MKLVVGLGNPGKKYEQTRHNLGFMVVDAIARRNDVSVTKSRHRCLVGEWQKDGEKIILAKPQTYMNQSGVVVKAVLEFFSATVADLIVIHDDLDLPLGRLRIRSRGGAGGHRGIVSLLEELGDEGFLRVRIGIGRPSQGIDPSDFVLLPFAPEEHREVSKIVSRAADAIECVLEEGARRAMDKFNRDEGDRVCP
ncbi:MAG: aminoacyl-tRNA hydrolase [Deltaproteobacteria bacterium]|nr:aminoacyl-tRNA hydrolase [Deltaproteobacteria bacterium]